MLGSYRDIKFLIILLSFSFFSKLAAQETGSIFIRNTLSIYNPAFTGIDGPYVFFTTRSQWKGVDGAPRINSLIYDLPQKKNVHLGFIAQNDKVFIENKTLFAVNYNYSLKLADNRFLFLAIKGGGFYNNIDINEIESKRIYDDYNPALSPVKSYFTPIFGLGMHYKAPNYFLGIGIPSLFKNKRFEDSKELKTTATDYSYLHLSAGGKIKFKDIFTLNPTIIYRSIPTSPNILTTTLGISYKEKFSLGGVYSSNENLGVFITSKNKWGFEWGYGYEFTSSAISKVIKNPTHELMIRINLRKKAPPEQEEDQTKQKQDEIQ
tara:strand:+ start:206 stop:1168 length:963 start_codon:yes stop_codon:yes gene_type:complete